MRYSLWVFVFLAWASLTSAAPPGGATEAELRDLHWRLYERVDFPLRLRRIDSLLKVEEARLKSLEKMLAEYQSFQKFSTGNPLTLTVQDTELQILETKTQIDDLREERRLLERYKGEQRRLFELQSGR